jgi:hypothetical protein
MNSIKYRVSSEENQFSVISCQFIKIFVIASSDLSERGNLCSGLLRHFVPRNDISVFSF